jgi:hypothetical protein
MSEPDVQPSSARAPGTSEIVATMFTGAWPSFHARAAFLAYATSGSLSRAAFSKYIFARSAELERWGRSPRPSPAPTGIDVGALQQDLQALFFRRVLRCF